jgi:predicted transcriptional regulator of viral defense system
MNTATALRLLRDLGAPVVTTSDAAALLQLQPKTASKVLERLAGARHVHPIRRGLWSLGETPDPYLVAGYVTAPYPAYVSLLSALYLHGLITQIPASIYVVTLGRSRRIRTPFATYSAHRVAPALFGGFDASTRLATPEKALFDVLYLSGTRGRLFSALPEVEWPRRFRWQAVHEWLARIPSPRATSRVRARLRALRR